MMMVRPFWIRWLVLGCGLFAARLLAQDPAISQLVIEVQGAQKLEKDGKQTIKGYVKLSYEGVFLITADEFAYDPDRSYVMVRGNVKIDYYTDFGTVEVTAGELHYDVEQQSGYCLNVTAQFGEEFFFVGDRLEISNRGERFLIDRGVVTACNQPTAQWSIRIRKASVEKEGYAVLRGAKFRIKNADIFYVPFLVVPAMQKRRSGLLQPDTGNSQRNGVYFSQPYYWAPREDIDLTLTPTYFLGAGLQLDSQLRYQPRHNLGGILEASFYDDKVLEAALRKGTAPTEDGQPLDKNRYRVKWIHDQALFGGHFETRVEAGSDFSVDRDYLEDAQKTRLRDYYYRTSFYKSLDRDLLSIRFDRLDRILSADEQVVSITRLPEIRFYQPRRHLGGGFYYRSRMYFDHFELDEIGPEALTERIYRFGLESQIARTLDINRFVHTRYGLAYRGSYFYRGEERFDSAGDTVDRGRMQGGFFGFVETVGPRLQRDYSVAGKKLVHYVDAGLNFRAGQQEKDPFLGAVRLDELDIRTLDQPQGLQMTWRLNSRLFFGGSGSVRPLMEMEISQNVNFESESENVSNQPVETRLRLINLAGLSANGIFKYNPDNGEFETLSIYGSVNQGNWRGYGGYVKRRQDVLASQESFIGASELLLPEWNSRFRLAVDYDIANGDLKSQEILYGYQGQCVGLNINYVKSPFDSTRTVQKDYLQVTVSLRNLSEIGNKF